MIDFMYCAKWLMVRVYCVVKWISGCVLVIHWKDCALEEGIKICIDI